MHFRTNVISKRWSVQGGHLKQWLRCCLGCLGPISERLGSHPGSAPSSHFLLIHAVGGHGDGSSSREAAPDVGDLAVDARSQALGGELAGGSSFLVPLSLKENKSIKEIFLPFSGPDETKYFLLQK